MAGIGEVVAHLKKGGAACREGWNGKGMFIYLNGSTTFPGNVTVDPAVVLKTATGSHQPGWVVSQADLLAEDWELLSDNPINYLVQPGLQVPDMAT